MPQNRWVSNASWRPAAIPEGPVLPSLEAVYLTDPVLLAAVLPPPLEAPPEPRVHAGEPRMPGPHGGVWSCADRLVGHVLANCHDRACPGHLAKVGTGVRHLSRLHKNSGLSELFSNRGRKSGIPDLR